MRRFSQRNSLVTLSDINITPLLDLAFVLLIIFIITTPLLENSIEMTLPIGGRPERPMTQKDFRTVEVGSRGGYILDGKPMTLAQIESFLVKDAKANPNLALRIRADKSAPWDQVFQVADVCANNGIKVSFRSEPLGAGR
jgi:biopolymer transport protein ExbD